MDIEKIIRDYLPDVVHMSLGTTKDNRPWVCEVHFAYDENLNLYFSSLASRRHSQEIAANPQVAGNIVKQFPVGAPPLGVYFEGTARHLQEEAEQVNTFQYLKERFNLGDNILTEAKNPEAHQFYKINVQTWYVFGKLDGQKAQKYQLTWGKS